MAKAEKDNRRILRGVPVPVNERLRTYAPGEEDELDEVLTPRQVAYLKARGAIEGDFTGKADAPQPLHAPNRVRQARADARKAFWADPAAAEKAAFAAETKQAKADAAEDKAGAKADAAAEKKAAHETHAPAPHRGR